MPKKVYSILRMNPRKEDLTICQHEIDCNDLVSGEEWIGRAEFYAFLIHAGFEFRSECLDAIRVAPRRVAQYILAGDYKSDGWYWAFTRGLLVSLLTDDVSSLQQLCDWAKPKVKRDDYCPPEDEELLSPLIVASLFQEKPVKKFRENAEKISTSRKREFKLLGNVMVALHERDQEGFEQSVQEHVQIFQKKPLPQLKRMGKVETGTSLSMKSWLSLPMNITYLAGLKLGLKDPKFPADIMAYLITPKSAKLT